MNSKLKKNLYLPGAFLTLILIFSLSSSIASAQNGECMQINLPRNNFLIGETFQAEISASASSILLEEISPSNLEIFRKEGGGDRRVEMPIRILKVSNDSYYAYFNIPAVQEGSHRLKVKTICRQQERIVGAETSVQFSLEKENLGSAYEKLAAQVYRGWGNTEENSLSILALRNSDSALAQQGVQNLLTNSKNSGECWPQASCRVKDTALALVALKESGAQTEKAKNWLLDAQNSLGIGEWNLIATSQDQTCALKINNQTENLQIRGGQIIKALSFAEDERYIISLECNQSLGSAKVTHTYLGKVVDFLLEQRNLTWSRELSNEKCFGSGYRTGCDFESSAYAYLALNAIGEERQETLEWMKGNRNDQITLHQAFLMLFTGEDYYRNWLVNNQALLGYWGEKSLAAAPEGGADALVTSLGISALKRGSGNGTISSRERAREWLLDNSQTLAMRDLAAALYFAFSPDEIREILAVSPAAVKVNSGKQFELLLENKGAKTIALSAKYISTTQQATIEKGRFQRLVFNATQEGNSFLTLAYSGIYNLPVFATKVVQGKEIVENTSLVLPSIKFVGEGNLSLYNNQTSAIRVKLVNTNSQAVNDITILLSSELYQVLKASPEKINLEPNGEAEITLSINEGKNLEAGTYSGEIKARNSITATLPVKIEILESGQKIEKKEKDCFDLGFQCCTEIKDGTERKEELDKTCPQTQPICAKECKTAKESESGGKISPIALIIVAIIIGSIILLLVLRAKGKSKPRELKDVISEIEERGAGHGTGPGARGAGKGEWSAGLGALGEGP